MSSWEEQSVEDTSEKDTRRVKKELKFTHSLSHFKYFVGTAFYDACFTDESVSRAHFCEELFYLSERQSNREVREK